MATVGFYWWDSPATKRVRSENPAGVQVQQAGECLERILDRFGCGRFRLAPDSIATEAAEVHGHLGAEHRLDVAAVARSASGIRSATYSASIVDRERGWNHHASPWGTVHRAHAHGSNAIGTIPYAVGERYTAGNGERMRDEWEA